MSVLERIWNNVELYQLIKGHPSGVIIFGLRGEILETNEHFAKLLQCPESALYGKKYFDIGSADFNAKEAEILKTQAFVKGCTPLYQKKYEVDGHSVLVNQCTYLIKDVANKPVVMLAMISPLMPESNENDAALNRLRRENTELKNKLTTLARPPKADTNEEPSALRAELAATKEKLSTLERALITKDKALELKDAAIRNAEAETRKMAEELAEARGALEVALILEDGQSVPEGEYVPAGPFPDSDASAGAAGTPEGAPEDPLTDAPWEAEDVVHDDDVPPPPDLDPLNAGQDAPWEGDDVVYDDEIQGTEADASENSEVPPPEDTEPTEDEDTSDNEVSTRVG